jgi:hypothetical protein
MTLAELLSLAQSDPEGGKYRLVLYKADGMFWVRRGEASVPQRDQASDLLADLLCWAETNSGTWLIPGWDGSRVRAALAKASA